MRKPLQSILAALATAWMAVPAGAEGLTLEPLGAVPSPPNPALLDKAAAEIVAHDPATQRLFIANVSSNQIDIADISDPNMPVFLNPIKIAPFGAVPTSVAVRKGRREIAVAVASNPETNPGKVVFFDTDGNFLAAVQVGALPDMLTYTPDGKKVLVANEGQPSSGIDPEGSVSIIDVAGDDDDDDRGAKSLRQRDVCTVDFKVFNGRENLLRSMGIRIYGPGASASQDLEPEYLTVDDDSKKAWVTLQENNAIAEIDIKRCRVVNLFPLGFKDHSLSRNLLDASDRDGPQNGPRINITNWPVKGMYQPDAIAWYKGFLVTANEGDSRAFEETRVGAEMLNPAVFPAELKNNANLGRLRITNSPPRGKSAANVFSDLFAFGARSFSIWSEKGNLVFDSGDDFEQITATAYPANFNSTHTLNDFDTRSDDKGPEPEGIALGKIRGCTYAFITLERIGGVMVYNITDPRHPVFVEYENTRLFPPGDPNAPAKGVAGDLGPEGVIFIPKRESPIRAPLLVVANEVSGTTRIFKITATARCDEDDDDEDEDDRERENDDNDDRRDNGDDEDRD